MQHKGHERQSRPINLWRVAKAMRGASMYVVLTHNTKIPVSRNKRQENLEQFRHL